MRNVHVRILVSVALVSFLFLSSILGTCAADKQHLIQIASKTHRYESKQGFERDPKDIVNTLKDNDVAQFQTLLDGLSRSFGLDKILKGKGPFTLLAPTDRAFKQIPADDLSVLFANPKKLKEVLSYHAIDQELSAQDLLKLKAVKSMEGHDLTFSQFSGDLYVDKALVKVTDIHCSNGVIHVLDGVVMPPLSQ